MQNFLKKLIFKIFGQKIYLKILHRFFYFFYDLNLLKNKPSFKYHYFVKDFLNKGDYVIDIGANLGYFTKIFARKIGDKGRVFAVEPVKPFYETLKWGLKNYSNCTFYNNALGLDNKKIQLSTSKKFGYLRRTGLAHISDNTVMENENYTFNCNMVKASELFNNIEKIDYIKCDIEGYEIYVIPELKNLIEKFKPILQIETWSENRKKIFDFLSEIGYEEYQLFDKQLIKGHDKTKPSDLIYVHKNKIDSIPDSFFNNNL